MRVGITMALLGVILAFATAKVGAERTELTAALVGQQHAHANYQAQDIKHRTSILMLQNMHAEAAGAGKTNASDMLGMAKSSERYLQEAAVAKEWVDAFDPMIDARTESQEHFERGQLAAEIGIVIASIALMLKRREPWFLAMALGALSIALVTMTLIQTHSETQEAEHKIEESENAFDALRAAGKAGMIAADNALVESVKAEYGPLVK